MAKKGNPLKFKLDSSRSVTDREESQLEFQMLSLLHFRLDEYVKNLFQGVVVYTPPKWPVVSTPPKWPVVYTPPTSKTASSVNPANMAMCSHSVGMSLDMALSCVGAAMGELHLKIFEKLYVSHWGVQYET